MSQERKRQVAGSTARQADAALRRAAARERSTLRITPGQRAALAGGDRPAAAREARRPA